MEIDLNELAYPSSIVATECSGATTGKRGPSRPSGDGDSIFLDRGLTANLLCRAAHQGTNEAVNTGDMARLGQLFSEKILETDQLLVARQMEADEDANRQRTNRPTKQPICTQPASIQ